MNKLIIPFVFILCLVMAACSNDDDSQFELSGTYLEATTWDAELTGETHKCPVKKLTIVFNILSYNILEGIFTVGGFEISY